MSQKTYSLLVKYTYSFRDKLAYNWIRDFCYFLCSTETRSVFAWLWTCNQNRSQSSHYIMDSPVQNKKIQDWATNICGYNCKIEYIEGKRNVCADMSHLPYKPSNCNDDNELSDPDITDKTFEVSMINSSNINPKAFAQYDHQITDNQITKEQLNLPS